MSSLDKTIGSGVWFQVQTPICYVTLGKLGSPSHKLRALSALTPQGLYEDWEMMPIGKVPSTASIMLQELTKCTFSSLECGEGWYTPDLSPNQLTACDRAYPSWWGTHFILKAFPQGLKDAMWKTLLVGCMVLGLSPGIVFKPSGLLILLLFLLPLFLLFLFLSSSYSFSSFSSSCSPLFFPTSPLTLISPPSSFSFFFQSLAMLPKLTLN